MKNSKNKSEEEWKRELTLEEYKILREKGTEEPFSGEYLDNKKNGTYVCRACGNSLFSSDAKFESGTGWLSFFDVTEKGNVLLEDDTSQTMMRTEVMCATCGGHLGHVFSDGSEDKTGKRYCINSTALNFKATL